MPGFSNELPGFFIFIAITTFAGLSFYLSHEKIYWTDYLIELLFFLACCRRKLLFSRLPKR